VGHEVLEDCLALITCLAAFGIDKLDLVGMGGQTVKNHVVARLLEPRFGRAVGAQQLIAQAVNAQPAALRVAVDLIVSADERARVRRSKPALLPWALSLK